MKKLKRPDYKITKEKKQTGGRRGSTRLLALFLSLTLLLPVLSLAIPADTTAARNRRLTLAAAKSVAVANSDKILSLEMQVEAKVAARSSAIRSLQEKERNMSTFRWSPLLNFSFPTDPSEAESFEFAYKPTQLQYNIDTLKHRITDAKLSEYQKVSSIYIDIITCQAEIAFLKSRISNMKLAVLKNKARVAEGTATQAQLDLQNDKLENMESQLSSEQTKLLRAEQKLGREVGFSVTGGYTFEEAFVGMDIDNDTVESLQTYAVDNDQTVYEAQQAMNLAQIALATNYELMRSKYGNNIGMISGYIQQAMDGQKIDKRAFKKDYDAFLKKIDEPWVGKKRILFFKFPKEWWKGDTDGIRYVEDDPYVLYAAALEYEGSITDYNNAVQDLCDAIRDGYDSYIEARKDYIAAQDQLARQKENLIYAEAMNALGQMSLEEYETIRSEYESARSGLKSALQTYSSILYSFDRTCCGGASGYFVEESLSSQTGGYGIGTAAGGIAGGNGEDVDDELNRMNAVIEKGATYSIRSIVDSQEFMLYIDIPEDFEYPVTDFELWSDGRQIGSRTPVGESLRHLRLTVQAVDTVFVRLYNGTEFFDDCSIDPTASYGPLLIRTSYEQDDKSALPVVGTYTVEDDTNTDMIRLRFNFDQPAVNRSYQLGADAAFYNLSAEKRLYLFSNDLVSVEDPFTYMSFIKGDIDKLTLRLFDEQGSYIGGCKFNDATRSLYVDEDVTLTDMQEIAGRELVIDQKTEELSAQLQKMQDMYLAAQNANSAEEESATETYYRNRIAELQDQINNVAADVTYEDVQQAIARYPDEIEKRVAEMTVDEETGERTQQGMSAEEEEARANILTEAAKEYIRDLREEETREQVQKAITEDKKSIAEDYRKLQAAITDGDEALADEIRARMEAAQKRIDANTDKLGQLRTGEDISEEEIAQALLAHGDEIYAASADRLTDDMLYGSEIGQWAMAYLEEQKISVTPDTIRDVVANGKLIPLYQNLIKRKGILQEEMKKAEESAKKLEEAGTTADLACAKQLREMMDAYGKELKKLESDLHLYDPAKDAKIREMSDRIAALESERNRLLSVREPEYLNSAAASLQAAENALVVCEQSYDAQLKDLNDKISTATEIRNQMQGSYLGNILSLNQRRSELTVAESTLDNVKTALERAKNDNMDPAYIKALENRVAACRKDVEAKSGYLKYFEAYMNEENSIFAGVDKLKKKVNEDIEDLNNQIARIEVDKASALASQTMKRDREQENYNARKKEWDASEARKKEIDAQIKQLNAEIDAYRG